MNNNRIKGIVGLLDINKKFSWDSRHEFPTNTLDSFIFSNEYAKRMSSMVYEEIEAHTFNSEFHTELLEEEINELTENMVRRATFKEKMQNKNKKLIKRIVPIQAGSKTEFMFRAKGLVSAVMETLHAVVTMKLNTAEQAHNLEGWLVSQDKWFSRKDNELQFKLDAISNVSSSRDNMVSRLLSGAYEMYATIDNKSKSFAEQEIKEMKISSILENNKKYFVNQSGKHKVTIGYFINNEIFVPIKEQRKKVEFDMYILMDFAYQLATHNATARTKNKKYDKFYFDYLTTIHSKTDDKKLLDKMINHKISGTSIKRAIIAGNMEIINEEGDLCL